MANNTHAGMGTSLSSSYFLRNLYISNRDAGTSSKRSSFKNSELSLADGMALRRAVKNLGSFTYDDDSDKNIRNSVQAFISAYNNTVSSVSDSTDHDLKHDLKQLKNLTSEYKDQLDDIGITVNENGTLTSRSSLFSTASLSKFKELFSGDSTYMQRVSSYSKRIEQRSEALNLTEKMASNNKTPKTGSAANSPAELLAETLEDTLPNTGIGKNVNIVL